MINRNLSKRKESKFASKNSRGITLIALVVTITVLIILATVSINTVLGDNGIIKRAQKARDSYSNSQKSEDEQMAVLANEMAEYDTNGGSSGGGSDTPTNPTAGTTVAKPGTWTSSQVTPIADGNGGTVPLPNGFHYVGGDISTGLVISDKQGDTMNASGVDMGNQFVWIPVSSEADLERTYFDTTTGQPTTGLDTTKYTEPYASGYSTEASEYTTMRAQVLKYGGFYIGRYEAGVNSTTLRTKVTTTQTVVCKKGVAPYNYVPWGNAMNDVNTAFAPSDNNPDNVNTNGAVYLAKNFASQHNYTSVISTLIYGCEWDAMCRYIGDSQRTTPTKSAPELTGSVSTDVSKNIYDLAGNCYELTMEAADTSYRVLRGGSCKFHVRVSSRRGFNPTSFKDYVSLRPTLYIK